MADLLATLLESPKAERVATGFVFTEGPLWHPDDFFYFVDIRQSHLHRIRLGKPAELPVSRRSWSAPTPARATAPRSTCRAGS